MLPANEEKRAAGGEAVGWLFPDDELRTGALPLILPADDTLGMGSMRDTSIPTIRVFFQA